MTKFNAKNLGIAIFLGILLVGVVGVVSAQQALPKGGGGFETAVKIEPGSYKGGSIKSHEAEYFYITDVKPGQEIKIKGTFTPETELSALATVDLYDEDRVDLGVGCYESGEGTMDILCEVSWMTNSDKESYKYYIRIGSDAWNITSYLLDVSLIDRYDAGSQTDAGDVFEKAMIITSGNYTAYLSGELGTDTKDFYKIGIKKEGTLTVKVTPPSTASPNLRIYNSSRAVMKEEFAPNPGAIIQASLTATKSENLFVEVSCDRWCSKSLVNYTLSITTEGEPIEEGEEGIPYYGAEGVAEKKGPNWKLILLAIIVLAIIIGIIIYLLSKKKKKTINPTDQRKY